MIAMRTARFPLGKILATPGALKALKDSHQAPLDFLARHAKGDWGEVCPEDRAANDRALENGERILSAYKTNEGIKVWVITEWDRSLTTILLPEEY